MKITKRRLRRIIRETVEDMSMYDTLPKVKDVTSMSKMRFDLEDLEHKHDQMMGFLDGQVGIASRGDVELAGEEIVDLRDQMAKLRAEQGLPEKDYSSNSRHKAERAVQGEIKFRKRGY